MTLFDRRRLLGTFTAAGTAALLPGCISTPAASPFFARIAKPIGIQLYALIGQDPVPDPEALFSQVRAMGFDEMELPNLLGQTPAALRRQAANAGIRIASLHVPAVPFNPAADGLVFAGNPGRVADALAELGINEAVIPFPVLPEGTRLGGGADFPTVVSRAFSAVGVAHWQMMAGTFNTIGAALKARGMTLGYHNHNLEFAPIGNTTGWDLLLAETDPELLKIQLDIGWVAQAGRDPVAELSRLAGRVVSLHVKDIAADSQPGFYFGMSPTQVGDGTIDWARVLPAAHAAGTSHYFVEQEPPYTMERPAAMARSLAYLRALVA